MQVFILKDKSEKYGTLIQSSIDQPWFSGDFIPEVGYERIKYLFDELVNLLNKDRIEEIEAAIYNIIGKGIYLEEKETGKIIKNYLLYIQGNKFRLRY